MKNFIRLLSYSRNVTFRLIFLLFSSSLGTLFGACNLLLVIPMLQVLFDHTKTPPSEPSFSFSIDYLKQLFLYYFYSIAESSSTKALLFICILLGCCVILANLFRYLERVIATKIRVDLVKNIRMVMYKNLLRLQVSFFDNERRGDLISKFTNDVHNLETGIGDGMKSTFKEPITVVVYLSILFFLSAKLTLFTILVLPAAGLFLGEITKRLKKKIEHSQMSYARLVDLLHETFGAMPIIKSFTAQNTMIRKFDHESSYYRKVSKSVTYRAELNQPISEIISVAIMICIFFYGGNLVLEENTSMEPEVFFAFLSIFASMIQPIKSFSHGFAIMQKGLLAGKRIFSLVDQQPSIYSKPGASVISSFNQSIEFKNISFAYDRELVLKDVELTINKGKTIAFVGPSGGGKSTLLDLLPRFYDPQQGSILIDGVDIRDYDLDSLRKLLGIVTQDPILFNDTIFNNITFGVDHLVNREAVEQAAQVAHCHEFILQTEQGYDTVIGERGGKLSGGQRQRLSIARAVLKNPPILILDEATSALDSESEKTVQKALSSLMENRTSLIIAHRLSTIVQVDEIVVVQNGKIEARGTHNELIKNSILYQKLYQLQQAK